MQPSLLFASLSLFLVAASPGSSSRGLPWEKDHDSAIKKAKVAGKPVMIDFWAEWCTWCHELDRTTYVDPKVVELAVAFIPVKVDTEGKPKERALSNRYDVTTLPTVLFVTQEGRLALRSQGYQAPEKFAVTLEKASRAAAEVKAWDARIDTNPKDAQALALLGQHLFEQGVPAESLDLLSRAVRLDAQSAVAERKRTRLVLAIMHARKDKFGPANAAWQEALAIAPAGELDPRLLLELERAFAQGDQADAAHRVLKEIDRCCGESQFAILARDLLGVAAQ
jgi:thioredoxin-like negative regulator of GroEL